MFDIELEAGTTAVVLVDLQNGVVARQTAPHSAESVMKKGAELARRFREKGSLIVYVRVDMANFIQLTVDQPSRPPGSPLPPASASELAPDAGWREGDVVITKRHWDAFAGTELEKKLRERKIKTVVLGGIATNIGVESTGRTAASLGFEVVLAEDATSSMSAEAHAFSIANIFPRLGRVRLAEQLHVK